MGSLYAPHHLARTLSVLQVIHEKADDLVRQDGCRYTTYFCDTRSGIDQQKVGGELILNALLEFQEKRDSHSTWTVEQLVPIYLCKSFPVTRRRCLAGGQQPNLSF